MRYILAVSALFASLGSAAFAQKGAKIDDFQWMAGNWTASLGSNTADRSCSQATGDSMMCMMRVFAANTVVWMEFSVLRETPNGIVLDTRFFSRDAQPAPPVSNQLHLKSATPTQIVFENPSGNQPKMETIVRDGTDSMSAHAELIDANGKVSAIDSKWHRVP